MKIVHISLIGPFTDGLQYQENLLPKYQARMGHQVYIIASSWHISDKGETVKECAQTYVNSDGITIIRLESSGYGRKRKRFEQYKGLFDNIRYLEPDLIFLHGIQFAEVNELYVYIKNHPTCQLRIDNHADYYNSARNVLSKFVLHRLVWRFYAKKISRYTTVFFGVTPGRVSFLLDVYGLPADKCKLLQLGADDDEVNRCFREKNGEHIRKQFGVREDDLLLVTGGKFDKGKQGLLALMDAVQNAEGVKLVVFGSVSEEIYEEFQKCCGKEKVFYVGWKKGSETYDYLSAADVVFFPTFHSVMWEQAIALGKPLVCKKMNGFEHLDLGGNVLYLQDDSVESFLHTIQKLQQEQLVDFMKKKAEKGSTAFLYSQIAKESLR